MKRFFLLTTLIACVLLVACQGNNSNSKKYDKETQSAIDVLKQRWEEIYAGTDENLGTDGYLEIKNTRLVFIKDEADDVFDNVDYIVEFVLFSDYFGSAPYYRNVGINDTVIFYRDGSVEVKEGNLFNRYQAITYSTDFSNIIESIEDLGSAYNGTFTLK